MAPEQLVHTDNSLDTSPVPIVQSRGEEEEEKEKEEEEEEEEEEERRCIYPRTVNMQSFVDFLFALLSGGRWTTPQQSTYTE